MRRLNPEVVHGADFPRVRPRDAVTQCESRERRRGLSTWRGSPWHPANSPGADTPPKDMRSDAEFVNGVEPGPPNADTSRVR